MSEEADKKGLNWIGLAGMIVFYFLIFFAGLFSEKFMKRKKKGDKEIEKAISNTDDMMLAGRDINYFIGIFTMTATWVGGGYINGAAEATIKSGILWCQAPFCYATSLVCGGLFFAKKMRDSEFVTMLDPFQNKYGRTLGSVFYIPAFSGEILWSASILAALGTSLRVICNLDDTTSIIISAGIAMTYTLFGGLYSVAFTDVFQLICIFVGLVLAIPFMTANENVVIPLQNSNLSLFTNINFSSIYDPTHTVLGSIAPSDAGVWIDYLIMMMCGGIPWQAYFQRVLSSRDASVARVLSVCAGFGCFCAAIPAVVIGVITVNTNWDAYDLEFTKDDYKLAVPRTLLHLCPPVISFIGLGAVSAAVMSSTDSSILGISSMFTRNVFKKVLYPKASDRVTLWFLRGTVVLNTAIAMVIAICVKSVYGLYLICSDLVFILLFPHLLLIVHFPKLTNKYGMIVGFSVAILLRVLAGEPVLGYEAVMKWPGYRYADGKETVGSQRFPFRVVCMLLHLFLCLVYSRLSEEVFKRGWIPSKFDILGVLKISNKIQPGEIPQELTKC